MAAAKPLYLASNLSELNKKVDKSEKLKQTTPKVLCRIADKMLLKAKDELLAGDEEQAYILYMRFIDMYKVIRASKEFKKDKSEINQLLPTSKVTKALDNAEYLSKQLETRYSEMTSEPSSHGDDDQVVPPPPESKPHPSTNQEPLVPFPSPTPPLRSADSTLRSIQSKELYQLLTQHPDDVLVLDCRPRAEFNSSHPDTKRKFPQWLGIPEELVKNGVTDKTVMSLLSPMGKTKWQKRADVSNVVLVDDHSSAESQATPLLALRDALFKYETVPLTSDPMVLEGGYAMWYLTYAVMCVGVYKRKSNTPPLASGGSDTPPAPQAHIASGLDYPSFPEIKESSEVVSDESSVADEADMETEDTPSTFHQSTSYQATPTTSHQATPAVLDSQYRTHYGPPMDGVVPSFGVVGPLPLPPSTIPVALSLEGEDGLMAPTLSSEHDLLSDYPQLMTREVEHDQSLGPDQMPANTYPVSADVTTFTQPPVTYPQLQDGRSVPQYSPQTQPPRHVGGPPQQYHQPPMDGQTPQQFHEVPASNYQPPQNAGGQFQQSAHYTPQNVQTQPPHPPQFSGEQIPHQQSFHGPPNQQVPPANNSGGQIPHQQSFHGPPNQQVPPPNNSGGQIPHQQSFHGPSQQISPPNNSGGHQFQQQPTQQAPPLNRIPPTFDTGVHEQTHPQSSTDQLNQQKEPASHVTQTTAVSSSSSQVDVGGAEVAKLQEETEKIQQLHTHMQLEMTRLQEVRVRQEEAAKQLEAGQAELEHQRHTHALQMQAEKKEFEKMKQKYDNEVQSMVAEKQRYLEMQEAEKKKGQERVGGVKQQQRQEFAQRAGLPGGWEKRLDQKTGRYYYVDHSSQTTHWNPPMGLINYQMETQKHQDEVRRQQDEARRQQDEARRQQDAARRQHVEGEAVRRQMQDEAFRRQQEDLLRQKQHHPILPPSNVPHPHLQPSHQTPKTTPTANQGALQPTEKTTPPSKPVIDRSVKPVPTVDRSKKPEENPVLWTPGQLQQKEAGLQPVFGVERQLLTGLRNLGNTCFMNSTLQCLAHTCPVMPYFTSLAFQKDINYANPIGHKGAVAKEFSWLMRALWSGRFKSVTPRDFKAMVDHYIPSMQGHAQQDAQEFLAFLMNGLHEDLNRVRTRIHIPPDAEGSNMDQRSLANLAWANHVKRNNSIIVQYFQGMYRSTVICNHCNKRSTTFEPFMYLSLPIPPGQRAYTLQECLRLFSEQETVSWRCSGCKRDAGAVKKIEIWKLPAILLIALSRFTYDGLWKEKRQNYIDYPVGKSLLNLGSYVVGEAPKAGYRLYAVSNHFGTQSGGHYTACCLNPHTQTYYNFDDHDVKEASAKQVKSGAGYLLFYTSLDHQAPKAQF